MKIKHSDLTFPAHASALAKDSSTPVPVLKIDRGNTLDQFAYEILPKEPDCWPVGKTRYWTNASGFTTATTYLGLVLVEVVEIPE